MYKLEVSISIVKQTEPEPVATTEDVASQDPVKRDKDELAGVPKSLEKMFSKIAFPSPPTSPTVCLRSQQMYDVPNERYGELLEILARFDKLACDIGIPATEGIAPIGYGFTR